MRLQRRVTSARLLGTAFLADFDLRFHKKSDVDGSGKCSILEGGSGIFVAVFDIEECERMQLDRIEGLGSGYEYLEVELDGYGTCSTYVAAQEFVDDSLIPMDWYKEYVVRGARFNQFPQEYVSRLEGLKSVTDFDASRSDREWKLISSLHGDT